MGVSKFLKRVFDWKISDKTTKGYNADKIKSFVGNVKEVDGFKYYYYRPHSKFAAESKSLENQPVEEVLSFLDGHFSESQKLFVRVQHKAYRSGRQEIILKGINFDGELAKIAVLSLRKSVN